MARNWPINSKEPKVGSVVILDESVYGHSAVITQMWEDEFKVDETNYIPCTRSTRIIRKDYDKIIGYYER